jgi:hypothetical protein
MEQELLTLPEHLSSPLVFSGVRKSKITLVLIKATDLNIYCKKIPKGNQNSYIERQTTQWPSEKVQKHKQRSTKHTHKTKDRVTRTPLKTGGDVL